MANGVRIAKSGLEDINKSKPEDLYVTDTTPLFKVFKKGSGTYTYDGSGAPGTTYHVDISHNIGYIPFFVVCMDRSPGIDRRIVTTNETILGIGGQGIVCFIETVDAKNITISVVPSDAGKYGYTYYIYHDRLNELAL